MKVLKINDRIVSVPLTLYKNKLKNNIVKYQNTKSLQAILSSYSMDEILQSVDSIFVSGEFICIPDEGRNSFILRLLQYGGANVKALNLLSLSYLGMEGGLL